MQERWHIELLGQLRLRRGDVLDRPLQRQKLTALLAYLAYHPRHPHPREALIELLWPEEDPEVGRRKLRSLLHDLHELLADPVGLPIAGALGRPEGQPSTLPAGGTRSPLRGPEGRPSTLPAGGTRSPLLAERTTVQLDPAAFTTDVAAFQAAVQSAADAPGLAERIRRLEAAVELYRGELLPGFFEPWVLSAREDLAATHLEALCQLAAAREQAGDLEGAVAAARQVVSVDPLREEAHYHLMRLYAATGQPAATLRQFQELERLLREELGEEPSAEARLLAEELRQGAQGIVVARTGAPPSRESAAIPAPPSGDSFVGGQVITMVVVDLVNSTAIKAAVSGDDQTARNRAYYETILIPHRQRVEAELTVFGGRVVKSSGDDHFLVFANTAQAVRWAAGIQDRHTTDPIATPLGPLQLRIGVHSGAPLTDPRDATDYVGHEVDYAHRVCELAAGGQILLSEAAAALVRDMRMGELALHPHGPAALKGIGRVPVFELLHGDKQPQPLNPTHPEEAFAYNFQPEQIFQLLHPDLPQAFPPLLTPELRPHHLPMQPTPLVGRETELEEVSDLLQRQAGTREAGGRLVTLTGPGGTGKTRLALQLAADLLDAFRDGAFFVDLAPLRDPTLLTATIAQVLGIQGTEGQPLIDTLKAFLRPRELLLLLDNFEQLLAAAPVVAELLAAAPQLQVLVTSRAALQLRAEHEYPVPPLPAASAVELFRQRAAAVAPHFRLTAENATIVTAICQRLEGLPLAIELAVGRLKLFPLPVLLARLDTRLPLLTGGARDLPTRQQTLRSAIAWSYDLLTGPEQQLFRRLSVFEGGFSLAAAEAVCNGEEDRPLDVLAGIAALVDQSLLRQEQWPGMGTEDEVRFGMLETIREFGQECLAKREGVEAIRRQHALFFLTLAERERDQVQRLLGEKDNLRVALGWVVFFPTLAERERDQEQRLAAERDNLRAALGWVVESGEAELGFRFAEALVGWWGNGSSAAGGRAYLARLLALLTAPSQREARARTLDGAGAVAFFQGDYGAMRAFYEESLAIYEELGQRDRVGSRHANLGQAARDQGDLERARTHYEQSLLIAREVGNQALVVYSLGDLGQIARAQGDLAGADAFFRESLAVHRQLGREVGVDATSQALLDLGLMAHAQNDEKAVRALREELLALAPEDRNVRSRVCMRQGHLLLALGDYAGARSRYEEGLALRRQTMETILIAWALLEVGHAAWLQGEGAVTQSHALEALAMFQEGEYTPGLLAALESLVVAALAQGRQEEAARLMGTAVARRAALGVYGPDHWPPLRERIEAAVRAASLEQEYAAAWAEGRAMSLEEAIRFALESWEACIVDR